MKIAVTADTHLNNSVYGVRDPESGLPLKTVDSFRALDFFVEESIVRKVDRVCFVGDIYTNHYPLNSIRQMFVERVQMLTKKGIQVVLLTGNHDFTNSHHALMPLRGWSSLVKVVDQPIIERNPEFAAMYIPHTGDIESGKDNFPSLVRSMTMKDDDTPKLFFGHFSVNGAARNDSTSHDNRSDVSVGDIESTCCDYAFLGHFHKYQRLESETWISYVGSIERHSISELNSNCGFSIIDTSTGEIERVVYDRLRPMKRILSASFDEAMDDIRDEDSWQDYIVRLDFEGSQRDYEIVRSRFSEVRTEFVRRGGCHITMSGLKFESEDETEADVDMKSVDQVDLMKILKDRISKDHDGYDDEIVIHNQMLDQIWKEVQ